MNYQQISSSITVLSHKHSLATLLGSVVLGLALIATAMVSLLLLPADPTQADGPDEAHIVVQFDDGDAIVRDIDFSAPISGLKALELTGLNVVISNTAFGAAVCAIEGVGDPASNCFGTGFWAYSFWNGSQWETYFVGASSSVVTDDAIELWAWSPGFVSPTSPGSGPQFVSAANALNWLADQQQADGGYGGPGGSADVLLAIGANKLAASDWLTGGTSLLDYWTANAADYADDSAGTAGKLAVGAAGASADPQSFAGLNLAISLTTQYNGISGTFESGTLGDNAAQSWAMLGWRAANTDTTPVPISATQWLVSQVNSNGGWGWSSGFDSDTNSTAVAVQALIAGGECINSPNIAIALFYLKSAQNEDGGFSFAPGSASDTNSTAFAIQALLAAGRDPTGSEWTTSSGNDPLDFLLSMQLPDGSFEWQKGLGSDQFATRQAIPALLGQAFPLRLDPPAQEQCFNSIGGLKQMWLPLIFK